MRRPKLRAVLATVALAGTAGLYGNGTFDPQLASGRVPLNVSECGMHPLSGQIICGPAWQHFEKRMNEVKRDLDKMKSDFEEKTSDSPGEPLPLPDGVDDTDGDGVPDIADVAPDDATRQ